MSLPRLADCDNAEVVPWAKPSEAGSIIEVWVVPGSSRTSIDGVHGGALKVRVSAPPERGRANDALVEHLESRLGAKVVLVSGAGSRRKTLEVTGMRPEEVKARLSD